IVRFGVFEVDFAAAELRKRGRRVKLEAQPFQVLSVLVRRPGELVTREELQRELWPGDTFVEFDHSLNTAVKKIRQALDDSPRNPRYIETAPRRGYRFIGETAPQTTSEERPSPPRPWRWVAGMAVIAVVAATAAWFAARQGSSDGEPFQVVPLTTYPGDEQRPSFSPDGAEVACQWNRDGNWDIFVKQIGVEEPFQLTDDPADELGPAWSPLGDQIAFVR
ncbi:MAG: winged helix-turn-helix transcriptional regulator, partial [bacterium]|nr:winged helix-turn-helix transcriptional regulator [bacterium]